MKITRIICALAFISTCIGATGTETELNNDVATRTATAKVPPVESVGSKPPVSCVDFYLVNPAKAVGAGLLAMVVLPYQGLHAFHYAIVGSKPVLNADGSTQYKDLDWDERKSEVRHGFWQIVIAPLAGAFMSIITFRSLNYGKPF